MFACRVLQRADARCANGDDPATLIKRAVDGFRRRVGYLKSFRFHFVFFDTLHPYRLESSQPHVEGDLASLHTAGAQAFKGSLREMKTRRRGGHRAPDFCVNGLVGFAVRRFIAAVNVGRQRDVTQAIDGILDAALARCQPNAAHTVLTTAQHLGFQFSLAEHQRFTHAHFASGMHESLPDILALLASQHEFDFGGEELAEGGIVLADLLRAFSTPPAEEPRGKYFGVVEYQEVAGPEDLGEVEKSPVLESLRGAVDEHHPRGIAFGERP